MPQQVRHNIRSLASPPPFKNSEGKVFKTLKKVLHRDYLKSIRG